METTHISGGCEPIPPSIWRRLKWALFPCKGRMEVTVQSMNYLEENYTMHGKGMDGDCIHCNLTTTVSFADRIRILFSGRVASVIRIVCEKNIGKSKTFAAVFPLAPGDDA